MYFMLTILNALNLNNKIKKLIKEFNCCLSEFY